MYGIWHRNNKARPAYLTELVSYRPIIIENNRLILKPSKGKGKAIPLQAWTGLEGSRRFRLPDFMTIGT
jgi:hypothetical protein